MRSYLGTLALFALGAILTMEAAYALQVGGVWLTAGKIALGAGCLAFGIFILRARSHAPRLLAYTEIGLAALGAVVAVTTSDLFSGAVAFVAGAVAAADGIGKLRTPVS
jgi:hypothetical protein